MTNTEKTTRGFDARLYALLVIPLCCVVLERVTLSWVCDAVLMLWCCLVVIWARRSRHDLWLVAVFIFYCIAGLLLWHMDEGLGFLLGGVYGFFIAYTCLVCYLTDRFKKAKSFHLFLALSISFSAIFSIQMFVPLEKFTVIFALCLYISISLFALFCVLTLRGRAVVEKHFLVAAIGILIVSDGCIACTEILGIQAADWFVMPLFNICVTLLATSVLAGRIHATRTDAGKADGKERTLADSTVPESLQAQPALASTSEGGGDMPQAASEVPDVVRSVPEAISIVAVVLALFYGALYWVPAAQLGTLAVEELVAQLACMAFMVMTLVGLVRRNRLLIVIGIIVQVSFKGITYLAMSVSTIMALAAVSASSHPGASIVGGSYLLVGVCLVIGITCLLSSVVRGAHHAATDIGTAALRQNKHARTAFFAAAAILGICALCIGLGFASNTPGKAALLACIGNGFNFLAIGLVCWMLGNRRLQYQ